MAQRILVVEDDRTIRRGLEEALTEQDYVVDGAGSGAAALAIAHDDHDLILLDLGLPDMDGLEVCRQLRTRHPKATVLILTAKTDEIDVVMGLDAGADDYLTKPFRRSELLARVRAHLRRRPVSDEDQVLEIDEITIDMRAHRVLVDGVEVELRPKEFHLLSVLAAAPGKAVSRDEILRQVWDPYWRGPSKTLDQHISSLRKRMGSGGDHIVTVRGIGYRFETR